MCWTLIPYSPVLENSKTTSVSNCPSPSLSLPLTCPLPPLLCALFCTLSLSYLLSLCPSPPLSAPPSLLVFLTLCMCLWHVVERPRWPLAVCTLHWEEDAVVCLLDRLGHPLLGGTRHRPAHLSSISGKELFFSWVHCNSSYSHILHLFTCPCMFVKELKLVVDDCGAVTQVSKGCVVALLLRLQLKHDKKLFFGGGCSLSMCTYIFECYSMDFCLHAFQRQRWIGAAVATLFWQAVQEQSHSLTPLTECTWG